MEIRGHRECQSCGTRWSYYETGEIRCPDCDSVRSVAVGGPRTHTASGAELDLTAVLSAVDEESLREVAGRAIDATSEYLREVGFVDAGELRPLDATYLSASELRRVAATVKRSMSVGDGEELYFLQLLEAAHEGTRPEPSAVHDSFHEERGLAVAAAVHGYLSDLRKVIDAGDSDVARVCSTITARRKRVQALDGAVDPEEAERLVRATRELSAFLRDDDEAALARAGSRFDSV